MRMVTKKVLLCMLTLVVSVFTEAVAQAPTTGASNSSINSIQGNRFRINWTSGNGARRIVVLSQSTNFYGTGVPTDGVDYNASSTFGSGDQVGSLNYVVYSGTGSSITVLGLDSSSTYYYRIFEYNGQNFSTQFNTSQVEAGSGTTLSPPSIPASALNATGILGNAAGITWTNGNGDRRIVLMSDQPFSTTPNQYTSYSSSATFTSAPSIQGTRIVYNGTGDSVYVTRLEPNSTYYVKVFEYNGTTSPVYQEINPASHSFSTLTAPTIGASNLTVTNQQGDRLSLNFSAGNGTRRIVILRQDNPVNVVPTNGLDYNANSTFGSGDHLGQGNYLVYKGFGSNTTITGLTPNNTYHIAVFEFNGTNTNTYYLTQSTEVLRGIENTLSPPTQQSSQMQFSNIDGNSMTASWTNGNGDRRLILARENQPVDTVPQNLTTYGSSSNFGSAPVFGNCKIVYNGTGNSVNLSNLQPGITYHFSVFEYNGTSGPVYNQTNPLIDSSATAGAPTVASSNPVFSNIEGNRMTLQATNGNGSGRIIIGRKDAPVSVFPQNGQSYSASTNFGNGTDLGGGNFVLSNNTSGGTTSFTTISGLDIASTYHYAIIEFNGSGNNRLYMDTTAALLTSENTLSAPNGASQVSFSNITPNSFTIHWTSGDGDGRLIVMQENDSVAATPNNLSSYSFNTNFSFAPSLGGAKIVYRGNQDSIEVTNIPPGNYHVAIFEYNGSSGPVYNTTQVARGDTLVGGKPQLPATNLSFSNIQGDRMSLFASRGDGTGYMIIAKEGAPVDAFPTDGQGYTANNTFGLGDEIGSGNFVLRSITTTGNYSQTVNGLQPNTTYHYALVEVNGSGSSSFYQDSSIVLRGTQATLSAPTVQTSAMQANNITGNSMNLTWTNGDGDGRIIIGRMGLPVDTFPSDLTTYSSSSSFSSFSQIAPEQFIVYRGGGTSVNLSNMQPDTTYHFAFAEYNGSNGPVYFSNPMYTNSVLTAERPTTPPSNLSSSNVQGDRMSINFTRGNGQHHLVVMRKGAPVNVLPQDLTTYSSGHFGLGSDLGDGNYVVANLSNTSSFFTVQNLEPETEYGVAVFTFDGSGSRERYLTSLYLEGTLMTAARPAVRSDGLIVNNLGTNSVNLSWTNGAGEGRVVFLRPLQPVTAVPQDLDNLGSFSTNYAFSFSTFDGDHKRIYRGSNSQTSISNLQPGTTYHVAIYEYNGWSNPVYWQTPLTGFFTTLPENGIAIGGFSSLSFCPGQSIPVPFLFAGAFNAGNVVTAQLSDSTGSFANPTTLGTVPATANQGVVPAVLPQSIALTSGYRMRVLSSSPAEISPDNGIDLQIIELTKPSITTPSTNTSCGDAIALETASGAGFLYQWYRNGNPIPLSNNRFWQADSTGHYQVEIALANGGCALLSDSVYLEIFQSPEIDFNVQETICINEGAISLSTVSPAGGAFSGNGISGTTFNPATAGLGLHLIRYIYTDPTTGCVDSAFVTFEVQDTIAVTQNLPDTMLITDAAIPLSGLPLGGTYSGTGIVGSDFSPVAAGLGLATVVYSVPASNGCDGVDTATVFVSEPPQSVFAPVLNAICSNQDSLLLPTGVPAGGVWQGQGVFQNTFYIDSVTGAGTYSLFYTRELVPGYSQTDTAILVVNANPTAIKQFDICLGQSVVYGGQTFSTAGTFNTSIPQPNGCDSLVQVVVQTLPTFQDSLSFTICDGDSVNVANQWFQTAGQYTLPLSSSFGCDSTVYVEVTVTPKPTSTLSATLCFGDSIQVAGQVFTQGGMYSITTTAANGCDSIISLSVTALPQLTGTASATVCFGDTAFFEGQAFSQSGTYSVTTTASNGCDSTISLTVNVLPQQTGTANAVICEGDTAVLGGQVFVQSGTYPVVLAGNFGCDSTVAFTVQVIPEFADTTQATLCQGDSLLFEGSYYQQSGTYVVGYATAQGCDSTYILQLAVTPEPTQPLLSINTTLPGMEVNPATGTRYEWERNGAVLPNDSLAQLINPSGGVYRVRYLENGCFSSWSDTLTYSGIRAVPGLQNARVDYFPNPTSGALQITVSQSLKNTHIIVTSSTGQKLFEEFTDIIEAHRMDFGHLSSGTYFLTLKNSQYFQTMKFTIQR